MPKAQSKCEPLQLVTKAAMKILILSSSTPRRIPLNEFFCFCVWSYYEFCCNQMFVIDSRSNIFKVACVSNAAFCSPNQPLESCPFRI